MIKANRNLIGIILGIPLIYLALSFVLTLYSIFDSGQFAFCLFDPLALDSEPVPMCFAIGSDTPILGAYFDILANYWSFVDEEMQKYLMMAFLLIGFVLMVVGANSTDAKDVRGTKDDPRQFLFTHRPKAFLKCLAMPWMIFVISWNAKKAPVIIPIIFIPFIIPYAVVMDIILIITFLIVRSIMTGRISSAAAKDKKNYDTNTEYAVCPKCKRNFYQPKIRCLCQQVLEYPVPDCHGVTEQACNRGHIIPCVNTDGARAKLNQICPRCKSDIVTHEAKPITISMVGPTGAGKTTMMLSAAVTLGDMAKLNGVTMEFLSKGISATAQAGRANVLPTRPGELDSEVFFIRSKDFHEKEIIINDIAGSEFEPDYDRILFEEYYKYNDGIIFAIDPVSVMAMFNSQSPTKGSKTSAKTVLDTFYSMYATINGFGPSVRSTVPFAVVLTNGDNPRVQSAVSASGSPERFLIENGLMDFVKIAGSVFSNTKYFLVSSIGKDYVTSADPFRWIFSQNDSDLKSRFS